VFFFASSFVFFLLLERLGGQQALEVAGGHVRDDGVEVLALAGALGGLGDLALDLDAHAARDALDTAAPKVVVERRVDAVVLRAHQGVGEGADLLDRGRRTLVEGAALETLARWTVHSYAMVSFLRSDFWRRKRRVTPRRATFWSAAYCAFFVDASWRARASSACRRARRGR